MTITNLYFENIKTDINIIHNEDNINFITTYKPLLNLLENLFSKNGIIKGFGYKLIDITIQQVIKFGKNIGFVLFDINILDNNDKKIPGIVFSRNNSVAILVTSYYYGKEYTLLVNQPRVSLGLNYNEIVAGIIENNNIKGSIINELEEEAGIKININKLNYLGNTVPSPGACNETIELYHTHIPNIVPLIKNSTNNTFGNSFENEQTKRKVILLNNILNYTNDSKSHICYYYYKSNFYLRLIVFLEYIQYLLKLNIIFNKIF